MTISVVSYIPLPSIACFVAVSIGTATSFGIKFMRSPVIPAHLGETSGNLGSSVSNGLPNLVMLVAMFGLTAVTLASP